MGVGFAVDLFTTHAQYESDHATQGTDSTREVRGWSSGAFHAALSTGLAWGLGAALGTLGAAVPIPGVDVVLAIGGAAAGAYLGDTLADNFVGWTDNWAY
jgi:hypothetical protein